MRLLPEERETIILLNEADELTGYFQFMTHRIRHWKKLAKRVGVENLIELRELKDKKGKTYQWDCKIPIRFLAKSLCFSTGKKRVGGFSKTTSVAERALYKELVKETNEQD